MNFPKPGIASRIAAIKKHLFAIPILLSVAFVARYSIALPLTDEWTFLRNAMLLHTEPGSPGLMSINISNHPVFIPALVYFPIGEISRYDSRALIALTLIAFALILFLIQWRSALNPYQLAIASAVVFGTGHYMEYMWGNQFTLAWSMAFPIAGLAIADQIEASTPTSKTMGCFAAGLVCSIAGVLCSAGGTFGFIALAILIAIKQRTIAIRFGMIVICMGIFLFTARFVRSNQSITVDPILIAKKFVTGLGGVLIGSEVGTTQFGLSPQSSVGILLVLLLFSIALGSAWAARPAPLAFPASLIAFGSLCLVSITVSRPYIGNWHLQYTLPIILGLLTGSVVISREVHSSWARHLSSFTFGTTGVLSIVGIIQGFAIHGPSYRRYTARIEAYANTYLLKPSQPLPFPRPNKWTLDKNMILFLSAKGHSLFNMQNENWIRSSLNQAAVIPARIQMGNAVGKSPRGQAKFVVNGDISVTMKDVLKHFMVHLMNGEKSSASMEIIYAIFDRKEISSDAVIMRTPLGGTNVLRRMSPKLVDFRLDPDQVIYSGMVPSVQITQSPLRFQPSVP